MAIEYAVPALKFIQYDGTNGTEIVDALQLRVGDPTMVWTITSTANDLLVIDGVTGDEGAFSDLHFEVPVGGRLNVGAVTYGSESVSPADWATQYVKV